MPYELIDILCDDSTGCTKYAQRPPLNAHDADVSSRARGLKYSLSLNLHLYFVYASTVCSGDTQKMRRVVGALAYVTSTKL